MLYRDLKVMFGGGVVMIAVTGLCLLVQDFLWIPLIWYFLALLLFLALVWCWTMARGASRIQRVLNFLILAISGVLTFAVMSSVVRINGFLHCQVEALLSLFS